jgi:hypothetical protein
MKKIKALGLAIWLVSLFLINVSAVSADNTNCSIFCCDNSGGGNMLCAQTNLYCASQANRGAGDLIKELFKKSDSDLLLRQ